MAQVQLAPPNGPFGQPTPMPPAATPLPPTPALEPPGPDMSLVDAFQKMSADHAALSSDPAALAAYRSKIYSSLVPQAVSNTKAGLTSLSDLFRSGLSYIPDPALRDKATGALDYSLSNPQEVATTAMRSGQQGLAGFNQGLGNVVLAPVDIASQIISGKGYGFSGDPNDRSDLHKNYDRWNEGFVPPPQTSLDQTLRAGGKTMGSNAPLLATGMGLAGSGIRTGATMAEQAAPGIAGKLRGAADAVLDWMGAHPDLTAKFGAGRAFGAGARAERIRQMQEGPLGVDQPM